MLDVALEAIYRLVDGLLYFIQHDEHVLLHQLGLLEGVVSILCFRAFLARLLTHHVDFPCRGFYLGLEVRIHHIILLDTFECHQGVLLALGLHDLAQLARLIFRKRRQLGIQLILCANLLLSLEFQLLLRILHALYLKQALLFHF